MEASHFSVTRDGQRLLMQKADRESSPSPSVMLHWTAALEVATASVMARRQMPAYHE
jgi:hypothetical protein